MIYDSDGSFVRTSANGTHTTGNSIPDPRFGMQSPLDGLIQTVLPSGLTRTTTQTREIYPASWHTNHGLNAIEAIVDTTTVNGAAFTTTFNSLNKLMTIQSPLGRTQEIVSDFTGRILEVRTPGLETIYYSYDAYGRLINTEQGSGAALRRKIYNYENGTLVGVYDDRDRLNTYDGMCYAYYDSGELATKPKAPA